MMYNVYSYNIIGHGTSWLHTCIFVWSLRILHHLGPAALGSVNDAVLGDWF